jgi:hypothetical protein
MTWYLLHGISGSGELAVALAMALLVVSGVRRVFTALLVNHRYRFTTWRWGRFLARMLAVGGLLKRGLPA